MPAAHIAVGVRENSNMARMVGGIDFANSLQSLGFYYEAVPSKRD
jgi:hypothetical protein